MTRDEILNMPAGREMDECIQRHVMKLPDRTHDGWFYDDPECSYYACRYCGASLDPKTDDSCGEPCIKHYSTDIVSAWQVAEKLGDLSIGITPHDIGRPFPIYNCWVSSSYCGNEVEVFGAKSAPLAICRAALLAVMEECDE